MKSPELKIQIHGNWCMGYYYEIVRIDNGNVYKKDGPYHHPNGRSIALEDACDYAERHDLQMDLSFKATNVSRERRST